MTNKMEGDMPTLLVVIGLLVGVYVIYQILSSGATQPRTRTKESKEKIAPRTIQKGETKRDMFYLSEFGELLQRYGIDPNNSNAFFEILSEVIREGKIYAKKELMKAFEMKDESDFKSQSEEFLKVYNKLSEIPPTLEFNRGPRDTNSPKIFSTALESWAKKFGLERELRENPEQTVMKIIRENLYQYGINSTLERLKVFKANLEKELASNNFEMLGKLLEMTRKELYDIS